MRAVTNILATYAIGGAVGCYDLMLVVSALRVCDAHTTRQVVLTQACQACVSAMHSTGIASLCDTMGAATHVGGAFRVIVRQVIRSSAARTLGAAVRWARLARSVDAVRAVTLLCRALTIRRRRCGLHLVLPSQARRV